jgi:hypothetical protein
MTNSEFINGPTNYAKLIGITNGIEKEIHVFFDKHLDLNEQTKCESFNSIDIPYYFYNLIKESTEQFDFFMEIGITELEQTKISNKREIYIKEVMKLFKLEFELKQNLDISISKTNPNIRLHYFDIRDHLNIFYLTKIINQKITKYYYLLKEINNNINKNINCNNYDNQDNQYNDNQGNQYNDEKCKDTIVKYKKKMLFYLDSINEKINNLETNTIEIKNNKSNVYEANDSKQKYYLNKIIAKYKNENIGKKINSFLLIHCYELAKTIQTDINHMKNRINDNLLTNLDDFKEKLDNLGVNILRLYSLYTDAYLLRRILDKNYIGKCIIYCENAHSVNFIFFLVKFLNFKIITIHNSLEKDLDKLTEKIKKKILSFDTFKLFLLDKVNIQCIKWVPISQNDIIFTDMIKYSKSKNI